MTTIAITRINPSPCSESWNACAVPWKLVVTVEGSVAAANAWIADTASPNATPGLRLNEIVTDGNWPVWLTLSGPTLVVTLATVLSGISRPVEERTYNMESAAGSFWNSDATWTMT